MSKEIQNIFELNNMIGFWDIPEDSIQVQGILKIQDSKLHMHTTEAFEKGKYFYDGNSSYSIINGITSVGLDITFWGNMIPSMSLNFPGTQQLIYTPSYIFVGKQLKTEKFKVKKISAMFEGLPTWIGQQNFVIKKNDTFTEVNINYTKPIFDKISCVDKTIYFETDCKSRVDFFSEAMITQRTWASIEFEKTVLWKDAYAKLFEYSDFLTLCFGTKCIPQRITLLDEENTCIQIFENNMNQNEIKLKPRFLIPYKYLKNQYEQVLNIWFKKQEQISPVISYFVDAHMEERVVNVIPLFLKMVQALESFSRKLRQSTLKPKEEHEARITRIISKIDYSDDNKWLSEVLASPILNEPSCQQRIKRLFDEMPDELMLGKRKLKKLSYKIVSTRNYYTHFNESLKSEILDSHNMFYSIIFMRYALWLLLVNELDIDVSKVVDSIKQDTEFITAVDMLELRK